LKNGYGINSKRSRVSANGPALPGGARQGGKKKTKSRDPPGLQNTRGGKGIKEKGRRSSNEKIKEKGSSNHTGAKIILKKARVHVQMKPGKREQLGGGERLKKTSVEAGGGAN